MNARMKVKSRELDIDSMTAVDIAREIKRTMARLAKLQAVLVEWSSNAEEMLETVTVHPVDRPAS